jgi:hypothetical protein
MYICQVTGKYSRKGDQTAHPPVAAEKLNKIVVATRERVYTRWIRNDDKAEGIGRELIISESQDKRWLEIFVGRGWEIVREINASEAGVKLWESWNEEQRADFLKRLDS